MSDSDFKTIKHRSLGQVIFGLPFLLGGLGMMWGIWHQQSARADIGELLIGSVVSLVFVTVGGGLALYRSGLVLDRRARRVVRWSGLLVPMWRKEISLADVTHLGLRRERRGSGKNARTVYPVILHGREELELQALQRYQSSRQMAESVAGYLALDLHDRTGGEVVIRPARHLDESLHARFRREGRAAPMPTLPMDSRLVLRSDSGEPVIEIPAQGFRLSYLVPLLLLIFFYSFTGPLMLDIGGLDNVFERVFFALFYGGPALAVLGYILNMSTYRETVRVSSDGLEITSGGIFRRTLRLPGSDVEEIIAPGDPLQRLRESMAARAGKASTQQIDAKTAQRVLRFISPFAGAGEVTLRSDSARVVLGRTLSGPDQQWLYQALTHYLVNQRGSGYGSVSEAPAELLAPTIQHSHSRLWVAVLALALIGTSAAFEFGLIPPLQGWLQRQEPAQERSLSTREAVPETQVDLTAFELVPARGTGHIDLYGRGLQVRSEQTDLILSVEEVLLLATQKRPLTNFRRLGLEIWANSEGPWEKLAERDGLAFESQLAAGERYVFTERQSFRFDGLAASCRSTPCYARLRLNVWASPDAPGWSVTRMKRLEAAGH